MAREKNPFATSLWDFIRRLLDARGDVRKEAGTKLTFASKIMAELPQSGLFDFDAGLAGCLEGCISDPLSLTLNGNEKTVLYNLSLDFIPRYLAVIDKVRDQFGHDPEYHKAALHFITGDFSDVEIGGASWGDVNHRKSRLSNVYQVLEEHEAEIIALFAENSISHWAMLANGYGDDEGTYLTCFYRRPDRPAYTEEEIRFVNALLELSEKAYDLNAHGWGGVLTALFECDGGLAAIRQYPDQFPDVFCRYMKDNQNYLGEIVAGKTNRLHYIFELKGFRFLVAKLHSPSMAWCRPVIAVVASMEADFNRLSFIYDF